MKTTTISLTAALIAMATLAASCESCSKKTPETTPVETVSTTENTYVDAVPDTVATAAVSPDDEASGGNATRSSTTPKTATATKSDQDGYGAANGTNKENNDGDQYTRNDPKPMPSGTSIK